MHFQKEDTTGIADDLADATSRLVLKLQKVPRSAHAFFFFSIFLHRNDGYNMRDLRDIRHTKDLFPCVTLCGVPSTNAVEEPISAVTHIQNTAPAPPAEIAATTPTRFPMPTLVAVRDDQRLKCGKTVLCFLFAISAFYHIREKPDRQKILCGS